MELYSFYSGQTLNNFYELYITNSSLAIKTLLYVRDPVNGLCNKHTALEILGFLKLTIEPNKFQDILISYSKLGIWKDYLDLFTNTFDESSTDNYYPEIDIMCNIFYNDFHNYNNLNHKFTTIAYYIPRQGSKYCKKYDIYKYVRDKLSLTNKEFRHWITECKKMVPKNTIINIADIYDKFKSIKSDILQNKLISYYYDNYYFLDAYSNRNIVNASNSSFSIVMSNLISYYNEETIYSHGFNENFGNIKLSSMIEQYYTIPRTGMFLLSVNTAKNDIIFVDCICDDIVNYIDNRIRENPEYTCIIWKCKSDMNDIPNLSGIEKNIFLINSENPRTDFNFDEPVLLNLFKKINNY